MSICKPDGVYDLELAYINAENDMDWLSSKVEELQSALNIKIDGKIETVEDQAQLQDEHNKLKITRFAQPYCCWEASENGVNTADADPEYYIGCNAFKVAKAEKIDKMLSFKGACDLLEENLADKIDIQFDDVKLMYEPRGESTEVGESADNICCTPKWFFIIDDKQPTGLHAINYVTVDCVTGEIYVLIP